MLAQKDSGPNSDEGDRHPQQPGELRRLTISRCAVIVRLRCVVIARLAAEVDHDELSTRNPEYANEGGRSRPRGVPVAGVIPKPKRGERALLDLRNG